MGHIESLYFQNGHRLIAYYRYVDDCFVLFNNKTECDSMFAAFNLLHPSINFTLEAEVKNKLAFLDVQLERKNDKFITSIFRKKTFTGQYVHFHSFCTVKRKINLIKTLCNRAVKICSPVCLDEEFKNILKILKDNSYPEELIKKIIQQHKNATIKEPQPPPDAAIKHVLLKLPFIGDEQASRTRSTINKQVRECYTSLEARVIFTSKPNFTPATKDPITKFNKSMVVYHFKCHCGDDYVGQTSRRLGERVKEHVPLCVKEFIANPTYDFKDNIQLLRASKKTAISKHLLENSICGTAYNEDCFSILRQCNSDYHLIVCEAVLIGIMAPTLCIQEKFDYTLSLV